MEIFTNWMNNLVAKPSFHSLIKKIPIIRRLAFNDGKIIYDLVAGFVYSQVLLAIIELRLIDFFITGKKTCSDGLLPSNFLQTTSLAWLQGRLILELFSSCTYTHSEEGDSLR